jgi:hypothetical protein
MDNRLLTFASVYELRSMAAPAVPVEPVVRPGMGARVMEGLSGAAGSGAGSGAESMAQIKLSISCKENSNALA